MEQVFVFGEDSTFGLLSRSSWSNLWFRPHGRGKEGKCPIMLQLLIFFTCSFLLSSRMHKAGIEWEKVEDPFNKCSRGEILLISQNQFFLLLLSREMPSSFSFLGQLRDMSGFRRWKSLILAGFLSKGEFISSPSLPKRFSICRWPYKRSARKKSIKHLIYHLHGIKVFARKKTS